MPESRRRVWRGQGFRNLGSQRRYGHNSAAASSSIPAAAPYGAIRECISLESITNSDGLEPGCDATIQNLDFVASYNILEAARGSIAVPGMPPKWTPPQDKLPPLLREDSGTYYRDVNAAYHPGGPLDPVAESIMHLSHSLENIDVFACGSTLGNLLRFISGESKAFRMTVRLLGGVVHLVRRESSPTEIIPDVRGYGHSFPEAYTTWDQSVKGSASHQRIVSYRFASLNMLVRSEGDGYFPNHVELSPSRKAKGETSIDGLAAAFQGALKTSLISEHSTVEVTHAGSVIPQQAIFDLKTRSIRRKDEEQEILADQIPRLWIRQIPNLILAYHDRGRFTDITVRDVHSEVIAWQAENQATLRRFADLLHRIVRATKCAEDGRLELSYEEDDRHRLTLRELLPNAPIALSASTEARWQAWLASKHNKSMSSNPDLGRQEREKDSGDAPLPAPVEEKKTSLGFDERIGSGKLDFTACDDECGYCGLCKY